MQKNWVYVWDRTDYYQHLSWARLYHLILTENAMHSWLVFGMVESRTFNLFYRAEPPYECVFQYISNCLTGILKYSFAESIFDIDTLPGPFSRHPRRGLQQRPFLIMWFIIPELTKGGEIDFGSVMGAVATGKACLLKPKHRKFNGCDVNNDFVAKVMPSLLHVFIGQVFNLGLDIMNNESVQKVTKVYLAEQKAGSMAHTQSVRTVHSRLNSVQIFPEHIAKFQVSTIWTWEYLRK